MGLMRKCHTVNNLHCLAINAFPKRAVSWAPVLLKAMETFSHLQKKRRARMALGLVRDSLGETARGGARLEVRTLSREWETLHFGPCFSDRMSI